MSGSSLDGLDIAFVRLEEVRGAWTFSIEAAACMPYDDHLKDKLYRAATLSVPEFLRLDTEYGRYLGEQVHHFIEEMQLQHRVHLVASHGHTVFHEPGQRTTYQLGCGAALAATAGLPVVSQLRAMDVSAGGQGAPIVPVGDKLLFPGYDFYLNIGGIANVTAYQGGAPIAFDICPANQVLNTLAGRAGLEMDRDGALAASGRLLKQVAEQLEAQDYYSRPAPKSLSNEAAIALAFPALLESEHTTEDLLHTFTHHIAAQIGKAVLPYQAENTPASMLVTGGGAFNTYLINVLSAVLA
ncbi:MAG: anhydro-N-acetylmuramic acid kinase, partial [Chitinophagia bacterium]|nr:anhydro-N-acetylmuramic acid kinase [Chitinophagia bacterium]